MNVTGSLRTLLVSAAICFGLIQCSAANGQDDRPVLLKRIADLERQVATLEKQLHDLRREQPPPLPIKVVSVRRGHATPEEFARALRFVYGWRPGFSVEPLNGVSALIIRADKKTMDEASICRFPALKQQPEAVWQYFSDRQSPRSEGDVLPAPEDQSPSATEAASEELKPTATPVRGLSSLFLRLLLGPVTGAGVGSLVFAAAGESAWDGVGTGIWVGLFIGLLAGILVWVFFPYKRSV